MLPPKIICLVFSALIQIDLADSALEDAVLEVIVALNSIEPQAAKVLRVSDRELQVQAFFRIRDPATKVSFQNFIARNFEDLSPSMVSFEETSDIESIVALNDGGLIIDPDIWPNTGQLETFDLDVNTSSDDSFKFHNGSDLS